MIIKITFKSHFKIKKNNKNNKKSFIFVQNLFILLLFSKIFLKNCQVNLLFSKKKTNKINVLKAPSRHKQFFHQIFYEFFIVKMFIKYVNINMQYSTVNSCLLFKQMESSFFKKMGTNVISRTRICGSICTTHNLM